MLPRVGGRPPPPLPDRPGCGASRTRLTWNRSTGAGRDRGRARPGRRLCVRRPDQHAAAVGARGRAGAVPALLSAPVPGAHRRLLAAGARRPPAGVPVPAGRHHPGHPGPGRGADRAGRADPASRQGRRASPRRDRPHPAVRGRRGRPHRRPPADSWHAGGDRGPGPRRAHRRRAVPGRAGPPHRRHPQRAVPGRAGPPWPVGRDPDPPVGDPGHPLRPRPPAPAGSPIGWPGAVPASRSPPRPGCPARPSCRSPPGWGCTS